MREVSSRRSVFSFVAESVAILAVALALIALCVPMQAQTPAVSFAGSSTTLPVSGLYQPWAVAVDASGNVYISNQSSHGASAPSARGIVSVVS